MLSFLAKLIAAVTIVYTGVGLMFSGLAFKHNDDYLKAKAYRALAVGKFFGIVLAALTFYVLFDFYFA